MGEDAYPLENSILILENAIDKISNNTDKPFSRVHIWFSRIISILTTEKKSERSIVHSREFEFSFSRIPLVHSDGLDQNQFQE